MAQLNFRVKADLVLGGRVCSPVSVKLSELSEVSGLAEPGQRRAATAGDITKFYVAAWVGGGSTEFSLSPVQENGVADVRLSLRAGDVDTVKFAVAFGLATPRCVRCCHLASSFVQVKDLRAMLSEPGRQGRGFTADQACLKLADNFTRNLALLRVLDAGSDLSACAALRLRPSSLLRLDEANEAVKRLGAAVERQVCSCAVSPLNAGSQFVQSFTFGHLSGHLTHYALLGHLFDCMDSPISEPLLLYHGLQAMHSTNLGAAALRAMGDADLAKHYGMALLSRVPACACNNAYCPDVTLALSGSVCKVRDTEDIGKTFSRLNFEVQNDGRLGRYAGRGEEGAFSLESAVRDIVDYQAGLAQDPDAFGARRRTPLSCADDCENDAQCMMEQAKALRDLYRACREPAAVARRLQAAADENPATFARCAPRHLEDLAVVFCRLGKMLDTGAWSIALAVASAKGPSYCESSPQAGEGLCGHGACISRVYNAERDTYEHFPMEGTTYLAVDQPPPEGYPKALGVRTTDGATQVLPLENLATVLAQSIHEAVGLSAHAVILAHLRSDYGDKPLDCPFYNSVFYASLQVGEQKSLGCIPLNTAPPSSFQAGTRPLFGAAMMGLSCSSTAAIPVTAEMLAPGKAGQDLARLLGEQVGEAWGPGVTRETLNNFLTYQQPVDSPDQPGLTAADYATALRSENTWAFDDPALTAKAVRVYAALAARFNELQAGDPRSDRATARAYGQFASACLNVSLPIPRSAEGFELSTMRNLRQAAKDIGLADALTKCALKSRIIQARAQVASDHPFYMCSRGEGLVHSHRIKL